MLSEVLQIDPFDPDPGALRRATSMLLADGLVAFPTETVYGLGANALSAQAVRKIFAAKGRPARNPVIVHVASQADALPLVQSWPESATLLAERFWPGPLTMVLPKSQIVPMEVTAGGTTVALRVPSHPVALALLATCRLPLAAPSANRSMGISPTRGEHVLRSLGDAFDLLLDAGPTTGGLESTVIDLSTSPPRLLRPGLITVPELEAVLGMSIARLEQVAVHADQALPSPGMLARHYAPRTPLEVVPGSGLERVRTLADQGSRVGWIMLRPEAGIPAQVVPRLLPDDPRNYAAQLYAVLHELDELNLDWIIVASPPQDETWLAINDRLRRAAEPS